MKSSGISVWRGLAHGLLYTLVRLVGVLRISWLWAGAILVAPIVAAMLRTGTADIEISVDQEWRDPLQIGAVLGYYFIALAMTAVWHAGLFKHYFKEPTGWFPVYLRWGWTETKLLAALLVKSALRLAVVVPSIFFGVWAIRYVVDLGLIAQEDLDLVARFPEYFTTIIGPNILTLVAPGFILFFLFYLILEARLSLIGAIVVKEGRIGVLRSWSLTRGYTLRLLGLEILYLILAALLFVLLILGIDLLASTFAETVDISTGLGSTFELKLGTYSWEYSVGVAALTVIYYAILTAVDVGASGYIYQRLTNER